MIFQPYRDMEAGVNQSLKSYRGDRQSNPEPLAPQAKSLYHYTTAAPKRCAHNYRLLGFIAFSALLQSLPLNYPFSNNVFHILLFEK